ncbi:NAD(P)/FAD-dependent oxidoreductase [Polaribacter sp. Asnod1-A03]|uniref:NAD(P)/FAD-dependent oxidoreductase n=1 Tax=Polaribacter sp. Asnod1-A03 TaxID=3160581 RepID=UPI00386E7842
MVKEYDVIVVGGGPAGGQCARNLSKKGHKVLLVEKFKSFEENNFSSAGMTLAPMTEFNLPESVVGSYWDNLGIQCTKGLYTWKGNKTKGVVLDFGRLRQFLADDSVKNGADVLMGHKYLKKEYKGDKVITHFLNITTKENVTYQSKIVVDGTGPVRKVMYDDRNDEPELVVATGIEYLIKVKKEVYDKYKDTLFFFLGYKWAQNGYSWIFAMEENILKVGSGKLYINEETKEAKSMKQITEIVIDDYLKLGKDDYELIDIHGGTLRYSTSIKDTFYKDKVVAIGDAISTVNPLGGEGIRYAMKSADLAAKHVDSYLKTGKENFGQYRKKWRAKHLFSWQLCELAARRVYTKYTDAQIEERMQAYHKITDIDVVINTLFEFKFSKIYKRVALLYYNLIGDKIKNVMNPSSKEKYKKSKKR